MKHLVKQAEDLVFDIGQNLSHKQLHASALALLKEIYTIENKSEKLRNDEDRKMDGRHSDEDNEIQKVARKLRKWAEHQDQLNSKILTKFLDIKRGGSFAVITKGVLRDALPDIANFESNLQQMSAIYEKNHAKVFEIDDRSIITIWSPVQSYVDAYAKKVFGE